MKKEKLVISLMVMMVLMFGLVMSAFAAGEPTTITTITAGNTTSASANGNATAITPTNGTVPISTATNTGNGTTIAPTTTRNNTSATESTTSSYRNIASNTTSNLPYTGSSYGIVFVIFALVISAIYAYKKVSDYNI